MVISLAYILINGVLLHSNLNLKIADVLAQVTPLFTYRSAHGDLAC